MNIFRQIHMRLCAHSVCRKNLFFTKNSLPDLPFAPYVVDSIIAYNNRAHWILHQKRFRLVLTDESGTAIVRRMNLPVGLERLHGILLSLQGKISEQEFAMQEKLIRLSIDRDNYRKHRAEHLVQLCDNQIHQEMVGASQQMLKHTNTIIQVLNEQICALTDAENQLNSQQHQLQSQIDQFYRLLPEINPQYHLTLPSVQQLEQIIPLNHFPDTYRQAKQNAADLLEQYSTMAETLKKQISS